MADKEKILQVVFSAIDEINQNACKEDPLEKSTDMVLFGSSGKIDSLAFMTFIISVEEKIEKVFNLPIILTSEGALSQEDNPFETVGELVDYIDVCLRKRGR